MLNVIFHPSEWWSAQINEWMGPFKDQAAVEEEDNGLSFPDTIDESEEGDDDNY
jgi:hypothetical protein